MDPKSISNQDFKIPTVNAGRECGSCNVCCTAMQVTALEKPSGQQCQHQNSEGCGIYKSRPKVCDDWYCMWIRDKAGIFSDSHRPDRLGVFFSTAKVTADGGPVITAHEISPHSSANPLALKTIQALRKYMTVRLVPGKEPIPPSTTPLRYNGHIVDLSTTSPTV